MSRYHRFVPLLIVFSICTISLSANARFAGMGNLSYLFQDDYHALDLYDFAGISSAFLMNDTTSSTVLRGSLLQQQWEQDSLTYLAIGQAVPQRLTEYTPIQAISFYAVIPEFDLVPCEFTYESRRTRLEHNKYGRKLKPVAYGVSFGYSQLTRDFEVVEGKDVVRTPSLFLAYAKPLSEKIDFGFTADGFYGTFNSADNRDKATLSPLGGGIGFSYRNKLIELGINVDYHYPSFSYEHTWEGGEYKESFGGHAVSPALCILAYDKYFRWISTVNYKWVALSGSANGNDIGDLDITGFAWKSQVLFATELFRLTGFVQYDYNKPLFTDDDMDTLFETTYKGLKVGAGAGVSGKKLRFGLEGDYYYERSDDFLWHSVLRSMKLAGKCGVEIVIAPEFLLRLGYNYAERDSVLDESYNTADNPVTNVITGGIGINAFARTRIDIAYGYKWTTIEALPDERITDHVLTLFMKHTWSRRR